MPRVIAPLLFALGLLPFIVGAAPDASTTVIPSSCKGTLSPNQLIPGLGTGQVVVSGDTATLRFASGAFACGQWPTGMESSCESQWNFTLTVPVNATQPGTYNLSAVSTQFGELFNKVGPPHQEPGCGRSQSQCSTQADGVGSVALADDAGPGATLEIYSASDECVTGMISGLADPVFPDAPDHNGAFFALRCSQ
jgi:hypothetical protein